MGCDTKVVSDDRKEENLSTEQKDLMVGGGKSGLKYSKYGIHLHDTGLV